MTDPYERELARSVDAVGRRECRNCNGTGYVLWFQTFECYVCNGTGTLPADEYDAMDEADDLYERAGDR